MKCFYLSTIFRSCIPQKNIEYNMFTPPYINNTSFSPNSSSSKQFTKVKYVGTMFINNINPKYAHIILFIFFTSLRPNPILSWLFYDVNTFLLIFINTISNMCTPPQYIDYAPLFKNETLLVLWILRILASFFSI